MAVNSVWHGFFLQRYRDQTCFSMHKHVLDPEGDVKNRAWKTRILTTPKPSSRCSVSENHVRSLLLHKVILSLENFGKNTSKSSYLYYFKGTQKHKGFVNLKNACSRAKTYVILTSQNYVHFYARYSWWRHFLWRPWMCIYM